MNRMAVHVKILMLCWLVLCGRFAWGQLNNQQGPPLSGIQPLKMQGDIASTLVAGADRFLLQKLEESISRRKQYWKRDFSSPENYVASVRPNRETLKFRLGIRDSRKSFADLQTVGTLSRPALVGRGSGFEIYTVRWPVIGDIYGEGLLLQPTEPAKARVVAIPDADQTPEQLVGLVEGIQPESQFARRLAEAGCQVVVPMLISREVTKQRRAELTHREYLYRTSFELGRHIIGSEIQKVLGLVDWFTTNGNQQLPIGVMGYGEGGLVALNAAAVDDRIDVACVSGYFDSRQDVWQEPIDRNVFGLLEQFGDAEIASLIAPRSLIVEVAQGPELVLKTQGGAPGRLVSPTYQRAKAEFERAKKLIEPLRPTPEWQLLASQEGGGPFGTGKVLTQLLRQLRCKTSPGDATGEVTAAHDGISAAARLQRQIHQINEHNQELLRDCAEVRKEFFGKLDTSSLNKYQQSVEWYRDYFRHEVIGSFDEKLLPPNVRSRLILDRPKWKAYEVVMDVFPEVIAYGILLLPKDIQSGDKRPVVVCQHGLEGRPQQLIQGDHRAYHDFAANLAERGFITFAPQNLYLFKDRFRTLQRKANPLKKSLFSIIVPQHQQITNWLASLPYVDEKRIGFYGLSYGGKTAMRVPPLVDNYALSICSADFNEWIWKNASTHSKYSYVWTGEYEIYEFNLGNTFNYAEMAALIAPRPFMVERGHFDGVSSDERVAFEFAKVRHLYQAKLGIGERCEIEYFVGPHAINAKGTFDFLHRHLNWPQPQAKR